MSRPTPAGAGAPGVVAAPRVTYVLVVLTTLVWGGSNVVVKIGVGLAPVAGLAAARFGLAALCFAALLAAIEPAAFAVRRADLPLLGLLGLTGITGANLLFFYGLSLAPVADAALITPSMNPLWTALFAALLLGERFGRGQLLGMGLSLLGVLLIVGSAGLDARSDPGRLLGDGLLVAGSACWALYTVLGRRALGRYTPLAASTLASLIGSVPLLLLAAPEGWDWLVAAPATLWLALAYLVLLGTVASLLAWYRAIGDLGAARAGQFTYLVPVWSLLLAAVVLGERPAPLQVAGGALVLVGLWLGNRAARGRPVVG